MIQMQRAVFLKINHRLHNINECHLREKTNWETQHVLIFLDAVK